MNDLEEAIKCYTKVMLEEPILFNFCYQRIEYLYQQQQNNKYGGFKQ